VAERTLEGGMQVVGHGESVLTCVF
jgi:hypothetical protein